MVISHYSNREPLANQLNGQHKHQQAIPAEAPPSPTLTNPDMILPYELGERESTAPSPPFGLPSLADRQVLHGNRFHGNPQVSLNSSGTMESSNTNVGIALSTSNRQSRSKWGYEAYAHGRPLSDIGEEDSQGSPPSLSSLTEREARSFGLPSSSLNYVHEQGHEEDDNCSSSSSSTISAKGNREIWEIRDGQDSDEGQPKLDDFNTHLNCDSENDRDHDASHRNERPESRATSIDTDTATLNDDGSSSAILSTEAERILENAKKRLTLMEGNLTRARSSLRFSPSSSPSPGGPSPIGSFASLRTHQPAGELYRSISRTDRRGPGLRPRHFYGTTHDAGQAGHHSRVHSETNLPSTLQSKLSTSESVQPSRSLSALGSTNASGFGADDNSLSYNSTRADLIHRPAFSLIPRSISPERSKPPGISTSGQLPKITTMEEFNSAYPSNRPPSRTQSQLQVRDLREQVEDLKSKISTLKVKTQEDNLRRRSLQSLRTPSPFAAAEQWYTSAMEYRDGTSNLNSNAGYGWSPRQGVLHDHHNESNETRLESGPATESLEGQSSIPIENEDINSVIESNYEDAKEDGYDDSSDRFSDSDIDRAALNEILNEPLEDEEDEDEIYEDFPSEATPHEEREDAFDYENFYLHSALGNYSRARMRRSSFSSTGSVETTRVLNDSSAASFPEGHIYRSRANSVDSLSTAATFATAIEGVDELGEECDGGYDMDLINGAKHRNGVHFPQLGSQPGGGSNTLNLARDPIIGSSIRNPRIFSPSMQDRAGSATPTSAFVSSLVSSVSAAAAAASSNLEHSSVTLESSSLSNDDTHLLEQLFQSLGIVCLELQAITTSPDASANAAPKAACILRRRLDAARRVLDGELDT